MRAYKPRAKQAAASAPLPERPDTDPVVAAYFADLLAEYGEYLRTPEETRQMVDRDMGDVTLTELLYRERAERR